MYFKCNHSICIQDHERSTPHQFLLDVDQTLTRKKSSIYPMCKKQKRGLEASCSYNRRHGHRSYHSKLSTPQVWNGKLCMLMYRLGFQNYVNVYSKLFISLHVDLYL